MQADRFIQKVIEHFPTQLPDPSRLFEGVRVESGHEKLECLATVEWPEFSLGIIDFVAGEFWQLSNAWTQYYLPAVMRVTIDIELEFNEHGELPDKQEGLMTILFSYWCSIDNFQTEQFDITKNVFYGLTSNQIDVLETWLNAIEFRPLDKTYNLPDNFNYTKENLSSFITKIRKFAA